MEFESIRDSYYLRILQTQGPLGKGFYHNLPPGFLPLLLGRWPASLCVHISRDETLLFHLASHLLSPNHTSLVLVLPTGSHSRNFALLLGIPTSCLRIVLLAYSLLLCMLSLSLNSCYFLLVIII